MVIGLMGGIGAGKSTVLGYLEEKYNAYIIQSDLVAKEIMEPGHKVFIQVSEKFPEAIKDGKIENEILSKIAFSDRERLKELNSITHPGTVDEIIERIQKSGSEIIVVESALLLGSGLEEYCDELWFVYCEQETRIRRLMDSRGYTREKAESIIKNQPTDDTYNQKADEFIDNSCDENQTREQIDLIFSVIDC